MRNSVLGILFSTLAAGAVIVLVVILIVVEVTLELNEPSHGIVTGKRFQSAWTSYTKIDEDTTVPVYHPASYEILFENDGKVGDCEVPEMEYVTLSEGDEFVCHDRGW